MYVNVLTYSLNQSSKPPLVGCAQLTTEYIVADAHLQNVSDYMKLIANSCVGGDGDGCLFVGFMALPILHYKSKVAFIVH